VPEYRDDVSSECGLCQQKTDLSNGEEQVRKRADASNWPSGHYLIANLFVKGVYLVSEKGQRGGDLQRKAKGSPPSRPVGAVWAATRELGKWTE